MSKSIMGIDFGTAEIKFAICKKGLVQRVVSVPTPENLIKNGIITSADAMVDFLKTTRRKERLGCKRAALVLPPALAYTKCTNVPLMTTSQLKINLPYEFRDYINQNKDRYVYDYAVLGYNKNEEDGSETMDLMACAALKSNITSVMDMFRKAGLSLQIIVPEEFAIRNILLRNLTKDNENEPLCLIDMGHTLTRIHIFRGGRFEVSKVIDVSGSYIDMAIAEAGNVDEHIARIMKENNQDRIQEHDECMAVYRAIGLEIMRALNFYNYESQSAIENAYVMGGCALSTTMLAEITAESGITLRSAATLLPQHRGVRENILKCICAIGATQQQGG